MAAGEGFGAQWEDDIELLKEAHRQIGSRIPAMHLPQLAGLPESWRLCGTGNRGSVKDCFETSWNSDPAKRYTALQLLTKNGSFVQQCIGAGVQTGPASGGLLVLDFDEPDDMALDGLAEGTFQTVFGRPSSELPTTATNTSGRRGRRKVFLMVPEDWWPVLGNWSFDAGPYADNKKHAFEAIWLNGTGSARQAVIAGDHPLGTDANPLYYHWVDGLHPAVVGVAVAPPWVIGGFIRQAQRSATPACPTQDETFASRRLNGEPQPCDLLLPKDQRRLINEMQEFWPYRGAPANSPQAASYQAQFRPLVAGLLNVLGKATAMEWLGGGLWDTRNNWNDGNLGSLDALLGSLHRSPTDEEKMCGWGSIVKAAIDGGYKFPKWALPPKDPLEQIDSLTKIINEMNQNERDPVKMALLEGEGRRLGVTVDRLYELRLNALLGTSNRGRSPEEIAKSRRADNPVGDVIDGVLRRKVTALAGASNSGKTTLAAFLVRTVLKGDPLAVGGNKHHTAPGKVLWLTSDCSDEAVEEELLQQGINVADYADRLRICDGATFNNMLDIVQDLQEFGPDLVVMDCLSSMALNGVSVADPAFVKPLRTLQTHNGKAWRRAAFVLLHHTTRDQPVRFSGGEQIKAAVEEMWIYYDPLLAEKKKPGERMKPSVETPIRRLWFEKCRSGFRGKELVVTYEALQNRWGLMPHSSKSIDPRAQLDEFFRNWRGDEWMTVAEWKTELEGKQIKIHPRTLERTMKLLAKGGLLEMEERFHSGSGKTRPHYRGGAHVRDMAAASWEGTRDLSGRNELE
jgi:molybdopterin-guanine dinucleotide biosynthesis protein